MSVRLEKMGECILRLREERGYSLEELAGLILSSPDELRKIESGTQQPDKMTLTLLSNVLNVYPDSLQNGEIHYRASQSNLINLMKETLKYLEGTEEDNKEIAEHIEKMQKEFSCDPKNILACVGPSICQECYEVSEDVIDMFRANFRESEYDRLFYAKENGKFQLDLWKANELVLTDAGIRPEHMAVTNVCTCCNPELLFSHRASKGKRGNLAAFIALKEG